MKCHQWIIALGETFVLGQSKCKRAFSALTAEEETSCISVDGTTSERKAVDQQTFLLLIFLKVMGD